MGGLGQGIGGPPFEFKMHVANIALDENAKERIRWGFERTGAINGWNRWFITLEEDLLVFRRGYALGQILYGARLTDSGITELGVTTYFPEAEHARHLEAVRRIIDVLLIGKPFCHCGSSHAVPYVDGGFECVRCHNLYDSAEMEHLIIRGCTCGASLAGQRAPDGNRFRCSNCGAIWWGPGIPSDPAFTANDISTDEWLDVSSETWRSIPVILPYSALQIERMRWGFRAKGMDEKWFIFARDEWLHFCTVFRLVFLVHLTESGVDEIRTASMAEELFGPDPQVLTRAVTGLIDYRLVR